MVLSEKDAYLSRIFLPEPRQKKAKQARW
jgi:hypothetical protein